MDLYYDDVYVTLFREWIMRHEYKELEVKENPEKANEILIIGKQGTGTVTFQKNNIIELSVQNTYTKAYVFYLHFQMNNLKHAMELFQEMVNCIFDLNSKPDIKVLLVCSGGLTTGYFCEKMQQAIELLDLKYQIDATGYHNLFNVGRKYDVILLAPQIAYCYDEAKRVFYHKTVLKIPPMIFATYSVKDMFDMIDVEVRKQNASVPELEVYNPANHTILSISLFRDHHRCHIKYILHTKDGRTTVGREIIKNQFKVTDLYDVIDTVKSDHPDLEAIGLSVPGHILKNGYISKTNVKGLDKLDFKKLITRRYHVRFFLYNGANSAALGLYYSQSDYQSMVCLFQPAFSPAEAGIVYNGKLLKGSHNFSGHMQFMPHYKTPQRDDHITIDGMIEHVAQSVQSIIGLLDPEVVILYCSMIPDVTKLHDKLKETIPEENIPDIIKITGLQDYILIGAIQRMAEKLEA